MNVLLRTSPNAKKSKKTKSQELVEPVFFISKEDMKKFLKKELEVTKGSPVHEEIGTASKEFSFRASKNFKFHVYPGKRISKKKRVAAGTAVGGTTGGVAGGVAGGIAGGIGGAILGGIAGAVIGILLYFQSLAL